MYARFSPYHRVLSWPPEVISVPCEPDGMRLEHGDGLPIDSPIETTQHDGAGVEGAYSTLTDFPPALLVLSVGCDGVHHDAGVGDVHGDVACKDLQRLVRQARGLPETVGEPGVDRGHRPLARRPESTEPE